ncbi:MAG: hypothetical protein P1U77_29335 [Rubripirellula sp.]|nr:hypothetical protein [Rubripirellula sp.]
MWSTVDGVRKLTGPEAELIRSGCRAVTDRLSQHHDIDSPLIYGIDWFDQWEDQQKRWLLKQVHDALLSDQVPPRPAAMWEATIDVIFLEVLMQIEQESELGTTWWRERVLSTLGRDECRMTECDLPAWRTRVTQLADQILGSPSYQKAEAFRDRGPEELGRYLMQKGLPGDFLEQIPPWIK